MDVVIGPLFWLILSVIDLYMWVIIISVVLSWLTAFNVVNASNRFVYLVMDFTYRLTEPALRRIRRILPNLGGIDISPVVLILLLLFLQQIVGRLSIRFGAY
jgi:YggT family protein